MHRRRFRALVYVAIFLLIVFLGLAFLMSTSGSWYEAIVAFDYRIDTLFSSLRSSSVLAVLMLTATRLGDPLMIIVSEVALLAGILIVHRKRIAVLFLSGIIVGELASLLFKDLLERARPLETIFHVSRHGFSFPSGHALLAMIFYGCLGFFIAHLLPKRSHKIIVACITGFVIFAIGISRVFLGVHWASDVLGGWALGGAVLSMVCAIFYKIHHHLKKEKITDLSRKEAFGIAILAAALGFFFIAYFVTHVTELRSIV